MSEKLEKVLENSFLQYSSYVIQRRAIPDARDMMKYTARQILHAQYKDKLDAKHPFKKSLKSVSAATAFSYVHGNTSCYEQIIRMGRPLVQRYFFEEINGNYGTPTGSQTYSADRYTEARLSELAMAMFEHIAKGTITGDDWEPTYDEEGTFPKVLPSLGYYNICNGSFGSIAPTMISSIPQFNLKEINNAIIALIRDHSYSVSVLPDFASGGILLNPKTTLASLSKGEGKSALIRGKVRKDKDYLEVTELPYGVYTNTVCNELEKGIESGSAPITSFKDLSKRTVNLRIYAKDLNAAEAWIYKNTSVQKHFTIKMIMLDNGKTPKLFSIKEALLAHINHAKAIWRRALTFELNQLKARQEIIEGLLKAYSIIDDIIATIKGSNGRVDSIQLLITQFGFTKSQAEAIVDLRLHRLSNIDIQALQDELESNKNSQADIQETLDIKEKFDQQLIDIYAEVASKFGDKRRTEISTQDIFETAQDGSKATENFRIVYDGKKYQAATQPEENWENWELAKQFTPEDNLIIVTDQVRGFTRKGSDFLLGETRWNEIIKLNPEEKVLFITTADELDHFDFVELQEENGKWSSLHKSFVTVGASARGKRLVTGKYQIKQVNLVRNASQYPKMR
jgi:DNA gyrase/topoisomerase IV subunit A